MKNADLTGTRPALLLAARWGDRGTLARESQFGQPVRVIDPAPAFRFLSLIIYVVLNRETRATLCHPQYGCC